MKEALFYKKLKSKQVQCELCPKYCVITDGNRGNCGVRENKEGKLFTLVYAKACSANLDPILKKPFYHFLPGEMAFSIATVGCNLHCKFCQNWTISQAKPEDVSAMDLPPTAVVEETKRANARIISYTYVEPVIFYEYMLDAAKLAKKAGLRNTIVSNGFINPEPLKQLCKYIDAANIDLKSISDKFYRETCGAWLAPVLETIKTLHKKGIWLELTNLIIPTLNDSLKDIKALIAWVKKNVGLDVPLHFTAFYPCYKLAHLPPTPPEILLKARQLALKAGLKYVYAGNILNVETNSTYCPKCRKLLIRRIGFTVAENNIEKGKCKFCGESIAGVWS